MKEIDAVAIPGYRIVSRIMAGGMATVYVAEQLKLGSRQVAIKIFRSTNPDHTKARHKRFAQEALIARNLQHPHVVQIFDYGSTDEFQFLVMEYLAHGDLKQLLREGVQPLQALHILQQVASALALLHQNGIVHRDIKPANILFREPDHAVLADFGIARSIDQNTQLTNTGFVLGTPSYMSPEQINGGRISAKTDMYALGVLFYEMLTGNLPYRGDSVQSVATQHLMAPVPPLPLEVRKLQPLLNRLMAKKVEDRMASGSELLQALAQIDGSRGFAVKPPGFVQLHARKIAAVAALMLCSVAVTWAGISQLPYWLDVAAPSDQHIEAESVATILAAPQPQLPAPAPNPVETLPPAGDVQPQPQLTTAATIDQEWKPQPLVSVAPEIVTTGSDVARKLAAPIAPKPKPSVRHKSVVTQKIPVAEQESAPVPVVAGSVKKNSGNAVAEQHAAYAVEAQNTSVATPAQPAPLPAEPEPAEAPAQKKKLPPVISYF